MEWKPFRSGVTDYRSTVNARLKPVLGKYRLKNLTSKHVADLET
jgi:hypothetical protein